MKQLGDRLDVPVGLRDADVTEVSGEAGHEPLHVKAGAVPLDEPAGGKRMPDVLESGTASIAAVAPGPKTDSLAEPRC